MLRYVHENFKPTRSSYDSGWKLSFRSKSCGYTIAQLVAGTVDLIIGAIAFLPARIGKLAGFKWTFIQNRSDDGFQVLNKTLAGAFKRVTPIFNVIFPRFQDSKSTEEKQRNNLNGGHVAGVLELRDGIPALRFDQATRMDTNGICKLKIDKRTGLSELPFYRDSFFSVKFDQGLFEVTRCRLDSPSLSDAEPIERIVARLMPEDCHFRVADIRAIGNRHLGLRHVSSHEQATRETEQGMSLGCSLNISFCADEGLKNIENPYYQFHKNTVEEIERRLPQYESAIDEFIYSSIRNHDLPVFQGNDGASLKHLLDSAKKTAFLVLNYGSVSPCDAMSWGNGLGRFRKANISAENITLLRSLDIDNWDIDEVSRKQYTYDIENVLTLLVAHYRKSLLDHIRT